VNETEIHLLRLSYQLLPSQRSAQPARLPFEDKI